MEMNWKQFANWLKVVIALEMTVLFFVLPGRTALEIASIGLAQYGLFFSVDLSIIIKNIKGVS